MLPGKLKTSSARKLRLPEGYRRIKTSKQKHAILFVAAMMSIWAQKRIANFDTDLRAGDFYPPSDPRADTLAMMHLLREDVS